MKTHSSKNRTRHNNIFQCLQGIIFQGWCWNRTTDRMLAP